MKSLAELLASHGSILLLDAASTRVQVGVLRAGQPAIWRAGGADAGTELFRLAEAALREAGLAVGEVGAWVYCAGPGSMLGVRTAAMALRTWQALAERPVYQYLSLALLAHDLAHSPQHRGTAVIADARRDSWHVVTIAADGAIGPLQRVPAAQLAATTQALAQPTAFRVWSQPPRAARACDYDLAALVARNATAPLFSPVALPDAFQHEAPEYKKWSATVHSAASAPRP